MSAYNVGDLGSIPRLGRSPGEEMATHSSTLAWKIPWMEEPGGLQTMGLQRVRQDWATSLSLFPFKAQKTFYSLKGPIEAPLVNSFIWIVKLVFWLYRAVFWLFLWGFLINRSASIFNSIQHTGRKSITQDHVSCKPKFKAQSKDNTESECAVCNSSCDRILFSLYWHKPQEVKLDKISIVKHLKRNWFLPKGNSGPWWGLGEGQRRG